MEETDRYGLFAQYDFELTGASLKNMASVRSQLSGLEKGIARVADAVNKSDFGRGLESASRRAQKSTSKAGTEIDELAQSLKLAEKRLKPLKREFRALRAEVRNIDFGELGDKAKFRQAAREVKNYVATLKTLESQIEGNTAAEREFAATLKAQQRISSSKLEMQMQQRNAALSAQRIGEFSALRDIGRNALIPINQEIDKGVSLFSSFDDSMASVGAVSRATEKEMEKLRQTAKKLGASTRYTSFQAAEAEKYLATAGFKTAQILGTVSSALELASAGELDLARSADISSNILSGFRLKAEQLSSVVDTLALTSASANTNIEQLGVAMTYAAPPASLFGASIEETSAFIGVMSNAGVQADKAGTAARSAFLRLASPVKQGKVALDSLGISTIDSSGNLRNFVDLMSEISDKLALDPETLKKIQMAGGDLELIENAIPDSKKIEALKGIFGTTGISGATAALTQMAEFKRLSLANLASSSNTDQLTQYFAQMGVKVAEGQDIFTAISEQAPDYQTAASLITQVNAQLMQSNLQTLSSLQRNKLYEYFKVSKDKDLFAEITRSTQDSQESVARLNTAMSYLGVEMKVETRAARQMAKTMEDNLAGSFRALASAAEAVYINLIEPLSPILRFVVDGITKVLLVIANAPYPIRLLIGSVVGLTAAMAATAVAVGTVGFFLFSFSQAAATAAIASQTLASGLIPLTGFFQSSMLGFIGTNPMETFFQYNTELVNDFSLAWKRTSQRTVGGLEGIYKAVVTVTKATFLLSRAFLFSPITLWVGSFLLLNAFIEQAIPGFNLLGSALSLVTAPLGFIWGLIKGIGQSLMEALGIVGGGTIGVLAAPIHTFTNALNNALETFKSFSDRGEELGLYLGRAIIAPIENAAILIDTIWQQVLGGIQLASMFAVMWIQGAWQGFVDRFRQILQPVVNIALNIAQQLINALNHNPTERIPEAWHKAVTLIKGYLSDLLKFAQDIGNRIAETGIAIATYFQNLIQSIANTVGVIGMVFRIVGKGISLLFKAFVFIETKAIQGIFLLGEATIWLYKTLFTVGLQAIDILKKTYDQAFETIQIFSSAFGYGEFSPDDRAIARQTLILGTLNAIGNAFGYIAQGGTKVTDLFHQLSSLVIQSINNFDLLTLALMTAASLPMTLIGMLDETAHLIVPELAILTQPGLFRALVYALPGIIATATATGITQGFQDGVAKAIAKLPDQLISKLDWANKLVPPELRDQVDFALSEIFNRPINTNEIYLQTRSFLDNQFRAFTDYLLQVGETIKESSVALRDFLKPILEYDFGLFDIQTIPIITTIAPAFQAIVEVFKSPTFAGVLQYLTFTVLPALGQTILAIAEYLNNIRLIITLPFVSVVVRMIQIVTEKIQFLIPQISNLGKTLLALSKTLGVLAVQGIAAFLRTIPYVGTFLANNFLLIVDIIATSFPIYINLLKRFISVDMLKALIPAYAKVVKGIATGIIYMFEQGFKPLAQLLFKALNPLGTFKLLNLYIKTQGFKGIIKTPPLLDFFGVLNFINPFDVLFSVSKDVNAFVKIFSDTAEFSYDMVLKKQTMLFQSLRTNNPAFFKYMRMGALIPLEELLEQSPALVKFFVQLTRGLMMISPIVQIVGRIALAFTVWYQILKPVNEEMLSAIASTEVMGYKLKLLADTIRVLRFLVVDGSDAFIWFAFFVPKAINAVVVAFRVLGDTAYYVLHDVIGLGILGFNALKITVINPLVVALIGATVALRAFLTVVQYALIFIRLKTQQYGDAIQKGFGAVMQQIASDVWGVISFLGIQLSNAFVLITSAVHRAWKSLTGLVGAIAHEIYLILVDPVGEFNRLLILLVGEVNNQIERTGTLLDRLPFKSLITLVQKYWKELVFAGGIALQFVKALSPAVRISLLLVDLALALVNEYTTGFKRLDTIIQVLSHPIALLDSMIKGLVNFLQGGFIPLDAADWISKFIAGFIKMIPVVMGGFFVVALLIKRDVGGAFQLVSDKVLLFIGRIIQAVDAVKILGYLMNRVYKGDLVQMNVLNAVHGVRSKDNFGPIQNPFAYSQNPVQQQYAVGIGDQRKQKAEALLAYQKELDAVSRKEQKRAERELIRQARTSHPDYMNPEHSFYMDSPDQPGVKVRMTGAQVEKRRNRFGIEEYKVTQLGRSVMGAANQGYKALRYGKSYEAEEARKQAAEKSGLSKVYQEYHGVAPSSSSLSMLSATSDTIEENVFFRSYLTPLLRSFQDFFENMHIADFKVNDLYVGRLINVKPGREMMTPNALDYQVEALLKKPKTASGLTIQQRTDLEKYVPTASIPKPWNFDADLKKLNSIKDSGAYDIEINDMKNIYRQYLLDFLSKDERISKHFVKTLPGGKIDLVQGVDSLIDKTFGQIKEGIDKNKSEQLIKEFQLAFQKYQAKMISADMGAGYERHFSDFTEANRNSISTGDIFSGNKITTGFDVITQGITDLRLSANRASDELTDELGATRKSLMSLIVESTGIPKMLESLNINNLLGRQVRGIERNVNRNNRQAAKFKRLASYRRETGLRAFLSNKGHTDGNLDTALTNYGTQNSIDSDTISILKNWRKTGKFQRELNIQETKGINAFSQAMLERLQGYTDRVHEDYKITDLDSLARMLNRIALDKTKPDFNSGHVQDFVRYLESDISTDGKNGITEDRLKDIAKQINKAANISGAGELDIEILKEIRGAIVTGKNDEDKNKLLKIIRQAILSDKRFDPTKFFVKADKDAIAKAIGFRYESQLRKIGETKLANPIQQLKQSVRDYIFQFEENMLTFHQENVDTLDRAKEFLLRRLKLEKLPFGNIAGRLDSIINAYSSFADNIKSQYLKLKGTGKENLGKMSTFFNERINFKSSIDGAISKFRTAKAGNFEGFLEMVGERQKTKVTRRSFQADFYQQMLTSGVDQADARKAMLALYKRQGDNKTLRQEMSGLDLNETAIASIEKVLSQVTSLKKEDISRHLMDKKGLSLKGMMPVQFYIAQEIPGILKGMFKDVRAITGAAIKVSKIDKIIGKIFTDVAAGLQQTIAPKMSSFVFRQARILSGLSLSVSNIIRRTFGENAVEKWFVGLSKTLFDSSKKLRADIKTLGKDSKSYTAKLLDAGLFLFKTLSNGIVFAAKALSNPKSIWASIQGFFGKVKNFFGKLFPKRPGTLAEVDQEIIRNQKIRETGKRLMNNSLLSESTREKAGKAYHSSVQELGRLKIEREALTSTPDSLVKRVMGLSQDISARKRRSQELQPQIASIQEPLAQIKNPFYEKSVKKYEKLLITRERIKNDLKSTGENYGVTKKIPVEIKTQEGYITDNNAKIESANSKWKSTRDPVRKDEYKREGDRYYELVQGHQAKINEYKAAYEATNNDVKELKDINKLIRAIEKENPDIKKYKTKNYSNTVADLESQRSMMQVEYNKNLSLIESLKENRTLILGKVSPLFGVMANLSTFVDGMADKLVESSYYQKITKTDIFKNTATKFKALKEKTTPLVNKLFASLLTKGSNTTSRLSQYFQDAATRSENAWRLSQQEVEGKTWPAWSKTAYRLGKILVLALSDAAHEAGQEIQQGLGQSLGKTEGLFSKLKNQAMNWAFPAHKINRQIENLKPAHQLARNNYESELEKLKSSHQSAQEKYESKIKKLQSSYQLAQKDYESHRVYNFGDQVKKREKLKTMDSLRLQIEQMQQQKPAKMDSLRLEFERQQRQALGKVDVLRLQIEQLEAQKESQKTINRLISGFNNNKSKAIDLFKNTYKSFEKFKEKVTPEINKLFIDLSQKGANATAKLSQYFQNAARRSAIAWRRSQREIEGKTWPGWLKAAYRVGKTLVMTLNHGTTDVISEAWGRTRIAATENMQQMVESAHEAGTGIQRGLGQSLEKTEGFFSRLKAGLMDWAFPVRKINRQIEALKPAHQAAKESYESQKVYTFKDERKKQQKYQKFDSINSQIKQLETQKEAEQMMNRLSRFMGGLFPGRQFKTPQQYPKLARIALKRFNRRFGNFFGGLFKDKSKHLQLPAMNFSSPRINVGKSMEDASRRVVLAWKRAGREIRGKEWPTLIKAASRVGKTLVNFLNHGAADVTAQAWENTQQSSAHSMHQMAQTAHQTGGQIQSTFERAINKTIHLFGLLGKSVGNVGKAGMAIGGVVSATGFAAQSVFYSLSNIGLIDEETSQSLYKVTELISIFGAITGLGTPLIMAFTSSVSALGTVAATVGTAVMGLGRALSITVGLGASPFAPLVLGIGAVSLAIFGLYKAFQSNFLGIRDIIQNTLVVPIEFIQSAWEGFVAKFGGILTPIVKPALDIAQNLINALNHNPTERIPEAWEGAKERIQGSLTSLVDPANKIGNQLNQALQAPDEQRKHLANVAKEKLTGVKFEDQGYLDKFKQWFSSLQETIVSVFSQNLITNDKLDIQTDLMQRQLKIQEMQQVQNLWRMVSNRDRNPKIQGFLESKDWFQSIKGAVNKTPLKSLGGTFVGKQLTKVGGFLAMTMGLSGGPLLSLSLGIGAVTTALALLYSVFADDFGGIRTKLEKVISKITQLFVMSVQAIKSAWVGFVSWFFDMPLVQAALAIAQGLINALNHNPTERIPEAWEGAITRIKDMFGWLIAPAQAIASNLTNLFSPVTQWFSGLFKPKQAQSTPIQKPQLINKESRSISSNSIWELLVAKIGLLIIKITEIVKSLNTYNQKFSEFDQRLDQRLDALIRNLPEGVQRKRRNNSDIYTAIGFAIALKTSGFMSAMLGLFNITKEIYRLLAKGTIQQGISNFVGSEKFTNFKDKAKSVSSRIKPFQPLLPITSFLVPQVAPLTGLLSTFVLVMEDLPGYLDKFGKFIPWIAGLSGALLGVVTVLEILTPHLNVLGVIAGGIGFIFRGISGVITGFTDTLRNFNKESSRGELSQQSSFFSDFVETAGKISALGESLGTKFGEFLAFAFVDPIQFIMRAWLGFSEWFSNLPLVDHALNIATGLINALNHNPTERIPEAWDVATNRISGMLGNTVTVAQKTGQQMTNALSSGVNTVKSGAIAVRDTSVDVVQNIRQVDDLKLAVNQGFSELKPILDIQNLILTETRKVVEQAIAINTTIQGLNQTVSGFNTSIDSTTDKSILDEVTKFNTNLAVVQEYLKPKPVIAPKIERGKEVAGGFDPLGQKGLLGIGGNGSGWDGGGLINKGVRSIAKVGTGISDAISFLPKVVTIVGADLFQNGEASIREILSQQMKTRQNELIQEMANNSASSSLSLSSEFSKYVTKGTFGDPKLTKEGQVYLETKLASEYRDRKGAFSTENIQQIATRTGKTSDQIYDIGLQGQPVIRDAIKKLPDKKKSLAEQIAPQVDRIIQSLGDILNELNTILVHVVPITSSSRKNPSQLLSSEQSAIGFTPKPQTEPKQNWFADATNFMADLWGKASSYFPDYYAKTHVKYDDDGKNNIVPYHPKSVGDVVNPIIKEKTSKLIPVVQQKASQIIPAAQQAIGGLADRWQKHRKNEPVVDDLVTNAETEWDNKKSWWEKNFKSIRKSWGLTSSTVSKGIGKLVAQAPDQGYELQKGLAEGSPGPTFYIRKYWKKTINQVTDWMGDLAESAAKTGISLAQSMGVGTVETAIAITPFVSEATKNEAIQSIEAGIISVQDRYDYLEAQGFGNLGVLFEPGAAQVTDALQLLGGDIADFAKRSVKALLTLNFGELAQASKDFGGNLAFALKGLTAGFNSMGLSAIAAGAAVLTGMAPAIITIGAIAFGAAVILANFLGIRSILKGVIQILVATGKIIFFTFMAAGRVLKGFSLILRGLFGDSELIKQGIAEIKGAFQVLGQQLKLEFKAIAQGFLSIGHGLKVALIQIFPFLKQPLQDLKQWFDEFWSVFALSPEWAGRMAAEALIDFVKNIFRAFNNLRLSIISTWQKMMVWFQIQLWEAKDWIVEVFRKIARLDFSFLQDIPNTLLNGFQWVAEKIPTLFQGTGDGIISRILKPIRDGFNAIAQFVKGFSDRINEELQLVFPGWMKSLGQSIIPLFDTLSNGAQGLREAIINLGAQWIKLALGFDLPIGYPFFEFLDSLVQRFQSTVITIEKAWLQFFVNAGKLEWNQITEDIGNTLKSGFKSLTTSVGQYWNQLWSTVLEAPTLKGKVDAFMSNFSFLSILNYVDDVAIAFDKLREKVGQVTSWLSNLIGTWNQVTDKAPKLKLDIDTASLETKANNLIDNVQGKWNQLVKFFENPKWPTARQTWQGLLDGYGWLRSQFRTITDWFGRTPEMLAPFFNQLKVGADKVSEFLFNMELQWVKLVLAFNLPLPMFYRLFEFINAIPKLFKDGVIQVETSWTWLANEIANLNWKTLTHVWNGFSKLFGLLGTSLDFAENKWREFQSYILTSPQLLAPMFDKLRDGSKGFGDLVVNLSKKWEDFITRFRLNLPLQSKFAELYYFSENFQGVITGIEARWERFATWLGTTELFSNILGGLKNLSYAFGAVTGFIGRHWNTLVEFLRSTQLLVHLGNGIVLLIEFVDNLSTTIDNLKQRWNTFLETNETTVSRIKQAWEGFTDSFKTILKPIVDFALDIAQKLINALNHNPTERIPEAWRKAVEFIQGKLSGLLDFAKDIGKQLISALVGKENADKFFGNFKEIKDNIFDLVNPIKILEGLGQGIVSVFNLIAETLPKLLNPMKLFNDVIGTLNYAMGIMSLSIPEQIPIWRSLFVVIGENLVSAFKQLDQVFLSVLNSIRDAVPGLKPFLDIIDLAKEAIQSLVTVSTKISFDFSFGFLEGFATKLEKINQTFSEFNEPLERISKSFKEIFLSAKDNIPQAFSAILDVFRPVLSSVNDFVSGITLTEKIGQGLGAIFADSLNLAVGGVKNAITVFADLLDAIAHPIQTVEKLGDVIKSVPSEAWKVVVEATRSAGEEIRLLMGGAFDWVSEKISSVTEGILSKWRGMFDGITSRLERFTGKTKVEGKKEEQHLSNDPPGPTYMIRKKWFEMLNMIEGRVEGFTAFTRQQGQQIQSAMTTSPQLSLANQISQYSELSDELSRVARLQSKINQRRQTNTPQTFDRAALRLERDRTTIIQRQTALLESLKQSDLVSPHQLSQLEKHQTKLNEITTAQQKLNQEIQAGSISQRQATSVQSRLDRQQIQSLERQSALIQEIQAAQQVQPGQQNMIGGLRGSLISMGSLLSNFAPQLATPLFVLNDFIDAFVDIKALLPTLQAGMLAWGNAIAASNSFVAGTFTILKAAALKAYKTLLVPILPFLPIILGVVAAVGLFYLAFKSNFLGIRDLIYGVGWAFKKFFGDLFGGFFAAIGSIFTTIDREVRAIASIFGELVSTVISIFDPILKLFNVDVSNSVLNLSDVLSAVVNALLFPIRVFVKSLVFWIKVISWGIQLIIKSLIFTVNVVKSILWFAWELVKAILIISATVGVIIAIMNFGAVLAGIAGAVAATAGVIASIGGIITGIITGVTFAASFLFFGLAGVIAVVGGAIASAAVAFAPIIAGIAVILGVAFVIKKVFGKILSIISLVLKTVWKLATDPMFLLLTVAKAVTLPFVVLFNIVKTIGLLTWKIFLGIGQLIFRIFSTALVPINILFNVISSLFSLLSNPLGFLSNIPLIGGFFGGQPKTEKPPGYATGGLVKGPGTRTGDRIHAKLSPGEYVINAIAAKANLPLLHSINAARAGMMPTPQIMAMPAFAPIPFFPPTQSESAGEQEININLSFGDIIVNGDSGDDLARDFIDKLRSPQVKMEIRQIMREFVERMR